MRQHQKKNGGPSAAVPVTEGLAPRGHAVLMPSFINGIERMRRPVAAKIALSTAGAATDTVGSPTPPQKPPDGTRTTSTGGISRMRSELYVSKLVCSTAPFLMVISP